LLIGAVAPPTIGYATASAFGRRPLSRGKLTSGRMSEGQQRVRFDPFAAPFGYDRYLRIRDGWCRRIVWKNSIFRLDHNLNGNRRP
jgi:hypothetical protein